MLSRSKESSLASFSFVGLASNSSRASPVVSRSLFGGAGVGAGEGKEEAAAKLAPKIKWVRPRSLTLYTPATAGSVARGMAALSEAWAGIRKIDFELGEMESNPQLVQIVPPNEVVVVIGFEVKLTNRAGSMALCIPYNAIEPLIEDLSAQSWFVTGKNHGEGGTAERIAGGLSGARVELDATLATTTISLSELRTLEVGDLIVTSRPATSPAVLGVEGKAKFLAQIGQLR
jgi:flagellar motor switch protein FliM